jgi:hypothetical protein
MTENERRLLRFAALSAVAVVIALIPGFRRRRHPLRWARQGVHDVAQPAEEAVIGLLGLDAPGPTSADLVADAAIAAIAIAQAVEHRHSAR